MEKPNKQPDAETAAQTARFWNERHQDAAGEAHDNYLNHPLIQAYISLRAFGSLMGHLEAAAHAVRSHSKPGDRILSLGCGTAMKERVLAQAVPDRQFVGLDIADDIIAHSRQDLATQGIENLQLQQGDFNALDLAPDSFALILGLGAIHHVEALEDLWTQCRKALQPGGVVMAQEYVGPNRFQWTDAQVAAGNHALDSLVPKEHQVHHQEILRTPVPDMIAMDPSEAVRSQEIASTCKNSGFEIQAYASAGGALLQPVLMYQVHTFDPQNWSHNLVLSRLFQEEDRLMKEGVLQDDFAMLVARPA